MKLSKGIPFVTLIVFCGLMKTTLADASSDPVTGVILKYRRQYEAATENCRVLYASDSIKLLYGKVTMLDGVVTEEMLNLKRYPTVEETNALRSFKAIVAECLRQTDEINVAVDKEVPGWLPPHDSEKFDYVKEISRLIERKLTFAEFNENYDRAVKKLKAQIEAVEVTPPAAYKSAPQPVATKTMLTLACFYTDAMGVTRDIVAKVDLDEVKVNGYAATITDNQISWIVGNVTSPIHLTINRYTGSFHLETSELGTLGGQCQRAGDKKF